MAETERNLAALTLGPLYHKLDPGRQEIRLLVLKPAASSEEEVRCMVQHTSLKSRPRAKYETISYVWGDPTVQSTILIQDERVLIPANAAVVLRRFRKKAEDRVLWIDAVCINQHDIDERSQQVALMAEVYFYPTQGLIRIGECSDPTKKLRRSVELVLADAANETDNFRSFATTVRSTTGGLVPMGNGSLPAGADIGLLLRMLNMPWFGRVWVVREAILPPKSTCYYGAARFSLTDILRVAMWLQYKRLLMKPDDMSLQTEMNRANALWALKYDYKEGKPTGRKMKLPKPKDRVFGMLGLYQRLVNETIPPGLRPDYSRSLTDILIDVVRAMIDNSYTLDFFDRVSYPWQAESSSLHDRPVPTWLPPFHRRRDRMLDAPLLSTRFNAHNYKPITIPPRLWISPGVLILVGFQVSRVDRISSEYPLNVLDDGIDDVAWRWMAEAQTELDATSEVRRTALASSIILGSNLFDCTIQPDAALRAYDKLIRDSAQGLSMQAQLANVDDDDVIMPGMYLQSSSRCLHRRCFSLEDGRIGAGPAEMDVGDVVVILYGCRWPLVLLEMPIPGHYLVRSAAYVHDIMEGTAVILHEMRHGRDEVFFLH
ncbi:hypothetical protein LTS14_003941 [Recurvomyces mirabilis]|uniref:uncharacterized protein n=1 Tax=Recurvomyces mirabilis TaxID=574656 RepID=UPI002DDF1228|nr:hypothetical protein LTS14_003941 [Recurvomyces mirabilis]